jgi:hypothetical protein
VPDRLLIDKNRTDKRAALGIEDYMRLAADGGPFLQEVAIPTEATLEGGTGTLVYSRTEYATDEGAAQKIHDRKLLEHAREYVFVV